MKLVEKIREILVTNKAKKQNFPLEPMAKILGFVPKNWEIYQLSLLSRSACAKDKKGRSVNNERLEYLGDAVLEAIVSHMLYVQFPNLAEGQLTTLRSQLVKRDMLNTLGEKIGLAALVKGKKQQVNRNIYGNAVEALIGAVYLDRGYADCYEFVKKRMYGKHVNIDKLAEREENYKSRLMEWAQHSRKTITYEVFDQEPTPPYRTQFYAKVYIDGTEYGSGLGIAKRRAEQAAAKQALKLISMGK